MRNKCLMRLSFWGDENSLGLGGGNSCTKLSVVNVINSNFFVYFTTIFKKDIGTQGRTAELVEVGT